MLLKAIMRVLNGLGLICTIIDVLILAALMLLSPKDWMIWSVVLLIFALPVLLMIPIFFVSRWIDSRKRKRGDGENSI